jgi:hypothetical protein
MQSFDPTANNIHDVIEPTDSSLIQFIQNYLHQIIISIAAQHFTRAAVCPSQTFSHNLCVFCSFDFLNFVCNMFFSIG